MHQITAHTWRIWSLNYHLSPFQQKHIWKHVSNQYFINHYCFFCGSVLLSNFFPFWIDNRERPALFWTFYLLISPPPPTCYDTIKIPSSICFHLKREIKVCLIFLAMANGLQNTNFRGSSFLDSDRTEIGAKQTKIMNNDVIPAFL